MSYKGFQEAVSQGLAKKAEEFEAAQLKRRSEFVQQILEADFEMDRRNRSAKFKTNEAKRKLIENRLRENKGLIK